MADQTPTLSPAIRDALRAEMGYVLDSRFGLRKNGESWQRYLLRQITVERVGLAAMLIFQLGGGVREARTTLVAAIETAKHASDKADAASIRADAASQNVVLTQQQLAAAAATVTQLSQQQTDLKDRLAQSITRTEFEAALVQRILPRLDRIEQRTWDGARR